MPEGRPADGSAALAPGYGSDLLALRILFASQSGRCGFSHRPHFSEFTRFSLHCSSCSPRIKVAFSRLRRFTFGGLAASLPSPVHLARTGLHGSIHDPLPGSPCRPSLICKHLKNELTQLAAGTIITAAHCRVPHFAFRRGANPAGGTGGICLFPIL